MSGVGDEVFQARYDHGIWYLRIHTRCSRVHVRVHERVDALAPGPSYKRYFAPEQVAGPTMDRG